MILVTVGNATQAFRRLLDAVDKLASNGILGDETILIQSGHSHGFRAQHCQQVAFLPMEEFIQMVRDANLVICHAGAGTLHHSFEAGKVPLVMPRRKKYGEHVDDQLALVRSLVAEGRVIPAYEPEDLPTAIIEAKRRNLQQKPPSFAPSRMIALVATAIEELTGRKA